jgi:hypothetical protein
LGAGVADKGVVPATGNAPEVGSLKLAVVTVAGIADSGSFVGVGITS